jgi:outer membrane protein assembly factor BamB
MRWLYFSFLFILTSTLTACQNDFWGEDDKVKLKGERVAILLEPELFEKQNIKSIFANENTNAANIDEWKLSVSNPTIFGGNIYLNEAVNKPQKLLSIKASSKFNLVAMPLITSNFIYLMDGNANIVAYQKNTKKIVWRNKDLRETVSFKGKEFLNGGMQLENGVVYATAGLNSVVAIDSNTGQAKWKQVLRGPSRAIPALSSDKVLIQTVDNTLYALDKINGEVLWIHVGMNTESQSLTTALPIVINNEVIVQYSADEVYKLSLEDGSEIWRASINLQSALLAENQEVSGSALAPTLQNGKIYTISSEGQLFCIDAINGELVWYKDLNLSGNFWAASEYIYAIDKKQQLLAVDKNNGHIRWNTDLRAIVENGAKKKKPVIFFSASPIVTGDKVLVNTSLGKQLHFNIQNGELISSLDIAKDVMLPPAIANGQMYLLSNKGRLFAN